MTVPICFHPAYEANLPEGHRFPMRKFGRVAEALRRKGLAGPGFARPEPATRETIGRVHRAAYVEGVLAAALPREIERAIGFPVNESVAARACAAVGGTLLAARLALAHGLAGNTAGGSHHAKPEAGAGYCVFNDVAIAARVLQEEGAIARALIVDCDVHQGDGTADCLARDPDLFTLSIHCERNFPARKIAGDLDIGLDDGLGDAAYLSALTARLPRLLDDFSPDLVFYNAGVDPHRADRLGRLALSDEGLWARDRLVVSEARARGIPLVAVLGGGYDSDIDALAQRHALVFEAMAAQASTLRP